MSRALSRLAVAVLLAASVACDAAAETIMQIQGTAHRSALAGRRVGGVRGIVTGRTGSGFYLQDATGDADPATSDALFVYTGTAPGIATGDDVEVAGIVFEYRPGCSSVARLDDETCSVRSASFHNLSVTEIVSPAILVHASGQPLPPATWIGGAGARPPAQISAGAGGSAENPGYAFDRTRSALDFFETLEGMRVAVAAPLVVGPSDAAGVVPVLADRGAGAGALTGRGGVALTATSANGGRILLDDLFAATPEADAGDALPDVEGIVDYRSGGYRVQITQAVAASDGSPPKQTAMPAPPSWLSIASFNVENLAATSSRVKIDGLAGEIAANLGGPALVALAEMQDDSGELDDGVTTADETFAALIAAIAAAGGPAYAFVQIDPEDGTDGGAPGANIRVGFLYDPLRVAFESAANIEPDAAVWSGSRKPLAARFRFRGRPFVAIALHLRSKSGDGPLFGRFQPPIEPSRDARAAQADVVGRFVETILDADPSAAVVALGDFNDFDFSPALARLEAAGLQNLTKRLPEPERYSFVFAGNAQALDHVLVSDALAAAARYQIVHVNSEYRAAERASDHDPVLAQIAMAPEPGAIALGLASAWSLVALGVARERREVNQGLLPLARRVRMHVPRRSECELPAWCRARLRLAACCPFRAHHPTFAMRELSSRFVPHPNPTNFLGGGDMSLTTVLSVSLIPSKARSYEEGVRRLAARAREKNDAFQWRAYQVVAGQQGVIHFVSQAQDFAELGKRDITPQALVLRLLGEKDGAKLGEELAGGSTASRYTIARERPDLSYPPDSRTEVLPMSVVTVLRTRAGHQDAAEELLRKISEAIPKVDDPARVVAYQTLIGDLRTYWTVRPIRSLADLDRQLPPGELLTKAFGAGEGGLISRSGTEALEQVERSITLLRPDLSNPS